MGLNQSFQSSHADERIQASCAILNPLANAQSSIHHTFGVTLRLTPLYFKIFMASALTLIFQEGQ